LLVETACGLCVHIVALVITQNSRWGMVNYNDFANER
jgi:hypothetical protein